MATVCHKQKPLNPNAAWLHVFGLPCSDCKGSACGCPIADLLCRISQYLLRCEVTLLARLGRADHRWICPFIGVKRSWEYAQMAATFRRGLGETGLLIVVLALVKPLSPPGMAESGGNALAGSPADFTKLIADETGKWAKVIQAANIKTE